MHILRQIAPFAIGLFTVALLACQQGPLETLQDWNQERQASNFLKDAAAAEAKGDTAVAIGKLRKAYALDHDHTDVPLRIARLYASLATKPPSPSAERVQAVHWLYRASYSDPAFSAAVLREKAFDVLATDPGFQSLARRYGSSAAEDATVLRSIGRSIDRVQESVTEMQAVLAELSQVAGYAGTLANWIGLQVILLLLLTTTYSVLLRVVGFPLSFPTWLVSLISGILTWHYAARILSGGRDSGWGPALRLGAVALGLYGSLHLLRLLLVFLTRSLAQKWRKSPLYKRLLALVPVPTDTARRLIEIEEASREITQCGHALLAATDLLERQRLSEELREKEQRLSRLLRT